MCKPAMTRYEGGVTVNMCNYEHCTSTEYETCLSGACTLSFL